MIDLHDLGYLCFVVFLGYGLMDYVITRMNK